MPGEPKYRIMPGHLEYANTDRQRKVLELRIEGDSVDEIAKKVKMKPTNVSRTIRDVFVRAHNGGFTCEEDAGLPDNLGLAGVTNYYSFDDNGERKLERQYVMGRQKKHEQMELAIRAFAEGLASKKIAPAKAKSPPKAKGLAKDLLPAILIGDAHIGMRAFGQETRHHDFDTDIATAQLREGFHYLTERATPSEQCLFVNVGDAMHANSQHNQTFSGTPLDVDTRFQRSMEEAALCMAYGIDLQLKKHKRVVVVMARGNHDTDVAGAIQIMLKFYYRNEPRVTVLPSHGFYHYIEWGSWLIGVHHGDKQKPESLAGSMARDMPGAWGRTTHRIWLVGHYHREMTKGLPGCRYKVCGALPPPDSWHAGQGYAGEGEMELMTFRKDGGTESSIMFNVPQPRIEPDVILR